MTISVRAATYRGDDGWKIYGRDPRERSMSIFARFARSRFAADHIAAKIRAGERTTLADFYFVPDDHPVRSVLPGSQEAKDAGRDLAECGTCGRLWNDAIITSMTPAPSARCPFEYFH